MTGHRHVKASSYGIGDRWQHKARARALVLATALVSGMILAGPDAHAAPARQRSLTRLPADHPMARVHAPTRQSGSSMRLPDSAFAPATVNSQYDYTETSAQADTNYFAGNHSVSYESLGGTDVGYYERADWSPAGTSDTVYIRYQGLQFTSSTDALNALQEGVNTVQKQTNQTASDCSHGSIRCDTIVYQYKGGDVERYDVLQVNQCLIETASRATAATAASDAKQMVQMQNNVDSAASLLPACNTASSPQPSATPTQTSAQPTPPPAQTTPTDFSITAIRILKKDNPAAPQLSQVPNGKKVWIFAILNFRSMPATSHETDTFILWKGHRKIARGTLHTTRTGAETQPGANHWTADWVKIGTHGAYRIQVRVTLNGVTHNRSLKIHVWNCSGMHCKP